MHAGMNSFSGDSVVNGLVDELLELLDYMDRVDAVSDLVGTPPQLPVQVVPPRLLRQPGGRLNPIDLTTSESDLDYDSLPVATPLRLDFTVVVDEFDNGGLFGRRRQ
jgi:hypothetical protein